MKIPHKRTNTSNLDKPKNYIPLEDFFVHFLIANTIMAWVMVFLLLDRVVQLGG